MDANRELFHKIFVNMNLPSYIEEDFIYDVFENVLFNVSNSIKGKVPDQIPNPRMVLSYILSEYTYLFKNAKEESKDELLKDNQFKNKMITLVSDKIFFNEYAPYKAVSLIDKYHPAISTIRFYLNFILNRLTVIKTDNKADLLVINMLRKAFLSCRSITTLLIEGFETEAFSTWRTIHETESIATVLYNFPYIADVYERHMEYIKAFKDEYEDKDEQQRVIDEIKTHLKEHDLKSKDLKKYIEYGWLYSIEDVKNKYPDIKLNFRNGVENVAGLSSYSKLYEFSSEIAHSSPILIYSNKKYFLKLSIICLYETFLRLESMFVNILAKSSIEDSTGFFNVRNKTINDIKGILNTERERFEDK